MFCGVHCAKQLALTKCTYLVLCWWPAVAWALAQYGLLTGWRCGHPENTPSPWRHSYSQTKAGGESNTTENTNNIIMLIMASTHIIIVHLTFNYTELWALLLLCSLLYIKAPKHHKCDCSQVGKETQLGPTVLIVLVPCPLLCDCACRVGSVCVVILDQPSERGSI